MQGPAWIGLLRRIPADQQDSVILMTSTSAQIVLQRLIRLENEFLVGMGRLAGSTDQGQLVVIPYDHLTYLSFNKKLADSEVETILGKPGVEVGENSATPTATAAGPQSPIDKLAQESSSPNHLASITAPADTQSAAKSAGPEVAKPNPKAPMPSKSMFLARLRQRLADDAGKKPKP
jgi:hypothetical protein